LRGQLSRHLPAWAIPATFTRLDELPLTANGKVDRAALPRPDAAATSGGPVAVRRTPTELAARIAERATELVAEHLPARAVDPRTRFFDAGLTSLDLVRLRQILVAEEGLRLDIVDLFERPTPQDLAEHLAASGAAAVAAARRPASRRLPRRRSP
jgi:aryl carrier-like protein